MIDPTHCCSPGALEDVKRLHWEAYSCVMLNTVIHDWVYLQFPFFYRHGAKWGVRIVG